MKNIIITTVALFLLLIGTSFAQKDSSSGNWLAKNSWEFGFGLDFPRYLSTSLTLEQWHVIGGFVSIQRNFSEHVGIRFEENFNHLQGIYNGYQVRNNAFDGNFDLLYYLVPCEVISPYVFTGLGGDYYWIKGSPLIGDTHTYDYQANIGVGAGTNLSPDWKVNAEFGVHSVSTKMFDGIPSLIHGRNTVSYATFGVGLTYMFNKGPKSHLCDLYNGLGEIDYHKIDELIKKDQPQPTPVNYDSIASIVKNNMPTVVGNSSESKWALIGINFEFNKATLTPESLPILANTAEILLTNPDINVEIEGNTDNIGSKHYNMELSIRRADVVKDYLISKGVAAGRITTKGMGKDNPVVSNKTAEDRMLNRRVVFIVVK